MSQILSLFDYQKHLTVFLQQHTEPSAPLARLRERGRGGGR